LQGAERQEEPEDQSEDEEQAGLARTGRDCDAHGRAHERGARHLVHCVSNHPMMVDAQLYRLHLECASRVEHDRDSLTCG
jgi:hypothetical protein